MLVRLWHLRHDGQIFTFCVLVLVLFHFVSFDTALHIVSFHPTKGTSNPYHGRENVHSLLHVSQFTTMFVNGSLRKVSALYTPVQCHLPVVVTS